MDIVDKQTRSRMMANIKNRNTKPEMTVRTLLHAHGMRYRLHRRDLPGVPDLVLPKYRVAVFVHGCFWHLHEGCPIVKMPAQNAQFWREKLEKNRERDQVQVKKLQELGWRVLIIWECITRQTHLRLALQERMVAAICGMQAYTEVPSQALVATNGAETEKKSFCFADG